VFSLESTVPWGPQTSLARAPQTYRSPPLDPKCLRGSHDGALSVPQVRAVYVLTGNDDFLIHVAVPDLPALHALLMDHFSKRKEVIGFRTSVIYDYASQPLLTFPLTE
jgi:DNA-binding Lrp family transcriptional regulator